MVFGVVTGPESAAPLRRVGLRDETEYRVLVEAERFGKPFEVQVLG